MITLKRNEYQLVDLSEEYKEQLYTWRNSERIRKCMFNDAFIPWEDHLRWLQNILRDERSSPKVLLYLNKPIGFVNFSDIDSISSKCYWGFYIGDENAPKGSGRIMAFLALTYIFENKALRKLCSEILGDNILSICYHHNLGFSEEGRLKEHILRNGCYMDVIVMALFNTRWKYVKKELQKEWGV